MDNRCPDLGPNSLHPDSATPAALGYRMPAEWEPHAATWLTWPRPDGISFPGRYEVVPPVLAKLGIETELSTSFP